MRHVYQPPTTKTNPLTILLGAGGMTLAVFLVLPLTQMISSGVQKQYSLSQVDIAAPPPPPEVVELTPPPATEPPNALPLPQLSDTPRPLSLGDLDLDISVGVGAVMVGGFDMVETSAGVDDPIFNLSDLDQRPQPIAQVAPQHPPSLLRSKIEGSVVLWFILDENGRITDPSVEQSSHPDFEAPALKVLSRWRFKPGMLDGKPVKTHVRQKIFFRINQ